MAGAAAIGLGLTDRQGRAITLTPVGDDWRAVADVAPRDDQRAWVPPTAARYLLLSMLEDDWTSLAIRADGRVVGHVMWGRDEEGHWIGGLVVDAPEQGQGVGRAATDTLARWLEATPGHPPTLLTVHPDNPATRLYASLGFRPTGEFDDDEAVLARTATDDT